jgi:general secretion pathway protein E
MQFPTDRIPYAFARRHGVAFTADGLVMREGGDPKILIEVRRFLGRSFTVTPANSATFDETLSELYAADDDAVALAAGSIDSGAGLDLLALEVGGAEDLLDSTDDAPAIRLINGVIADAARNGVSDIHFEPYETALVVRMRIDGELREKLRLPARVAPTLVSRIKVMSRLDIAERRLPQDGRISLTLGGRLIDVRVSTLPSRGGERVVLRLLDKANAAASLDSLGMDKAADAALKAALAEPNGIILVTGPTGSGKTTTLYAALQTLNDGKRNILTVEDPVEYAIDGIGQTQVDAKVGLTFAAGLRAILRQDPDVVLVGEIRDRETAEIAVQASLTGHLVLATVHTNDAAGAITRMRDMKVEPFLLASTLRTVIAQRLVRKTCPDCAQAGCAACDQSGFKGRIGVFETIKIDDAVRKIIADGGDELAITQHAFASNHTLAQAAEALVKAGVTTRAEAMRVSRLEAENA